jgi:hypothetical protein
MDSWLGSLLVGMEMQNETVAAQVWALVAQKYQRCIEITYEGIRAKSQLG